MLDYALHRLVEGISLPGILLVLLPIAFLHLSITGKRWIFLPIFLFFSAMSLPVTGKILLYPLEIGIPFEKVKVDDWAEKIDAVVVISNGLHLDRQVVAAIPNASTFSRVKRGERLASQLDLPLILSGTAHKDGKKLEAEILETLLERREKLVLISGATGTFEHAINVSQAVQHRNLKRLAVIVSGIHAYRTVAAFQKAGLEVPIVIVGLRYSTFHWQDIIPSFNGFFYWKHALREYAGLVYYWWHGRI